MSTPIVLRYLATSSHRFGVDLNKSASRRVHLIRANKSMDKLVISKILGEGIYNVGNLLFLDFALYSPRYDNKVFKD